LSSFSAEGIAARLNETPTARRQRELAEAGRAPVLATPEYLRAHEAVEEFARQRALLGLETTQDERDQYVGTYEAAREGA
jgi:UDP-glucose 6-dehydrogenase